MGETALERQQGTDDDPSGPGRFPRTPRELGRWLWGHLGVLDWIAIVLLILGLIFVGTGLLPEAGALGADSTFSRIWPILIFLATVLVLAELTNTAGLFDLVARRLAIVARGHFGALFIMCVAFASITTIGLNLDTTAVLLTPVMLALARVIKAPPLPLAMCTVWLANTASLLLPVSNLTNLLSANRVGLAPTDFAAKMGTAQIASLLVTGVLLWVFYWRRGQRGTDRYEVPEPFKAPDSVLLWLSALACLFFIAAILAGAQLEIASGIACGVVLLAFAIRKPGALQWRLIPWRLPVFVTGMFFTVQTISYHLLQPLLATLVSSSPGAGGVFRAAATGAGLANIVNNLPAYIAVESAIPVANHTQLLGLLIGVNVGPVILPWASLATLLCYERCVASGVAVPMRRFIPTGACVAVAGIALSVAALVWA
jgi:arsenical pump membrane protein